MLGRDTASPIASASLTSFLFDLTYGFTNWGAMSRTVRPHAVSTRAQSAGALASRMVGPSSEARAGSDFSSLCFCRRETAGCDVLFHAGTRGMGTSLDKSRSRLRCEALQFWPRKWNELYTRFGTRLTTESFPIEE
jgi:hypothetical protein